MSPAESPLRTFAFGALGQATWLAGWFPGPGGTACCGGQRRRRAGPRGQLAPSGRDEWRVTRRRAPSWPSPRPPPRPRSGRPGVARGFEQGARSAVTDSTAVELAVTLPGRRGERADDGELDRLDSVREVSAWFGPTRSSPSSPCARASTRATSRTRSAAVVDPEGYRADHRPAAVDHLHGRRPRHAGSASSCGPRTRSARRCAWPVRR